MDYLQLYAYKSGPDRQVSLFAGAQIHHWPIASLMPSRRTTYLLDRYNGIYLCTYFCIAMYKYPLTPTLLHMPNIRFYDLLLRTTALR